MHKRDDLPIPGHLPKGGEPGGDELEQHDFQLAGLALATLVLLVSHAGAARLNPKILFVSRTRVESGCVPMAGEKLLC